MAPFYFLLMKNKSIKNKENIGYLYIFPWLIGFVLLQLYPLANSLRYSFTDIRLGGEYNFIGLANYIRMFTKDKNLIKSLLTTGKYLLMSVPAKLIFALVVAMLLSKKIKGIKAFRMQVQKAGFFLLVYLL